MTKVIGSKKAGGSNKDAKIYKSEMGIRTNKTQIEKSIDV